MTKKAIRRGSVRKSLSEDAKKARMEQWAVRLGLPKDTAQKMIDKLTIFKRKIFLSFIVSN